MTLWLLTMASKYRDDTGELHPLFTGEDHGKDYHDGQRWRAGIPRACADPDLGMSRRNHKPRRKARIDERKLLASLRDGSHRDCQPHKEGGTSRGIVNVIRSL